MNSLILPASSKPSGKREFCGLLKGMLWTRRHPISHFPLSVNTQNSNVHLLGTLFSHLPKLKRSSFGILFSDHIFPLLSIPKLRRSSFGILFSRSNKTSPAHGVSYKTRNCPSVAMNLHILPASSKPSVKREFCGLLKGMLWTRRHPISHFPLSVNTQNSNVHLLGTLFSHLPKLRRSSFGILFFQIQQNQPRPRRFLQNPQLSERSDEQPHPTSFQ